jgi:hypothetical protein
MRTRADFHENRFLSSVLALIFIKIDSNQTILASLFVKISSKHFKN